ncbi:MAG: branched-chain amino acid ABC transporter permease [Fimbriimonadaceae bacterium]|nr:branched-chain amino acid ABC transporter permease [Fimbriimonadaceae bacterium]
MGTSYLGFVVINFELYLILALSLNLLCGYAGLVSLCHAAFYGVGAYGTALLMLRLGLSFPFVLLGAVLLTMLLGALVALPSLRLRDDYFIVATLAFQNIVFRLLYNSDGLTRGALGLPDLPPATVAGFIFQRDTLALVGLASALTVVVCLVLARLADSPFGRLLRAVRDDPAAVSSLGHDVAALKIKAFLVGSACAAVAGGLLAARSDILHPNEFTVEQSVLILTVLILGGTGNVRGPLVGALGVTALDALLRAAGSTFANLAGELNALLLAAALIVLLRLRPQGLAGVYRFE